MPGRYRLTLFGGFGLQRPDGMPLSLATRKTRLLLAYLALNPGRSHPRETLATLLWGKHGEAQARGSLRQSLAALPGAGARGRPAAGRIGRRRAISRR